MGLDPRFIITSDLQALFRDKTTALPMAGGIVTFYKDLNRTVKKPVYQLTGSPPNYSYSALPNPCILSGAGTFQDNGGNDIVPYYFPYEGTPDDSDGTLELYYITIENSDGDPQFTREGWPNATVNSTIGSLDAKNFIPNGQFLAHNDIIGSTVPPTETIAGIDIQPIAQGGWSFRRTNGGASTFDNGFQRISSGISGIDDFPRYAFNFKCTSFNASDQVRDLVIAWPDVNKFSSGDPVGSQNYTFTCSGESLDSNTYVFDVRRIYNYGTGGSPTPQIDVSIGTFTIGPAFSVFSLNNVDFPASLGTLGTNNDDYVAIALRGPALSWDVLLTDFALLIGNITITSFPVQTNADMLSQSVTGFMPTPAADGSDLYLPLVLTPTGMKWDHSQIGDIYAKTTANDFVNSISTVTNEIVCDGGVFPTAAYSPLGIPYSRLQARLWDSATSLPKTGTGITFVSCYEVTAPTNIMRLSTNQPGPQTAAADGTSATGFTFTSLFTGVSTYDMNGYMTTAGLGIALFYCKTQGVASAAPGAGTSGFTVTSRQDTPVTQSIFDVQVGALPAAGSYFLFSNTTTDYYVWFTVNGVGADPAIGGRTGILIPLLNTYSAADCARLIKERLSGSQSVNIQMTNASLLSAGDYFTFNSNGDSYAVWYEIDGLGTAPAVAASLIKVSVLSTDLAAVVVDKTLLAINSYSFAVPNLRGVILKGWNQGPDNIPYDFDSRFTLNDLVVADYLCTYQSDSNKEHAHSYSLTEYTPAIKAATAGTQDYPIETPSDTGFSGAAQTTPFNFYVNYVIKY